MVITSQRQLPSGQSEVKAPTTFEEFAKLAAGGNNNTIDTIPRNDDDNHGHNSNEKSTAFNDPNYNQEIPLINRLWNNVLLGNFGAYLKHLETTPQDLFKSDDEGRSVLHWAAFHDDTDVIRQIVKLGLPIDVQCLGTLQTPFIWAAARGSIRAMRELLSLGADRYKTDALGANALIQAIQYKQLLSVHFLLNNGLSLDSADINGCTGAHWAAYVGLNPVIYMLSPAQLNKRDMLGMTPLHRAADGNQLDTVQLLLTLPEVEINIHSTAGHTPLDRAKIKGYFDIENALAAAGGADTELSGMEENRRVPAFVRKLKLRKPYITLLKLCTKPTQFVAAQYNSSTMVYFWFLVFITTTTAFFTEIVPQEGVLFSPLAILICKFLLAFLLVLYLSLLRMDPGFVDKTAGKDKILSLFAKIENQYYDDSKGSNHNNGSGSRKNKTEIPGICYSCEIVKPDRSKHCSVCKRCVHKMDHHCGWLNRCVGLNNQRRFVFFVAFHLVCEVAFCASIIYLLYSNYESNLTWMEFVRKLLASYKLSLLVSIAHFPGTFFLFAVLNDQSKAILENVTGNERINMLRYPKFWKHSTRPDGFAVMEFTNPYDSGSTIQNGINFCCGDIEKTKKQLCNNVYQV